MTEHQARRRTLSNCIRYRPGLHGIPGHNVSGYRKSLHVDRQQHKATLRSVSYSFLYACFVIRYHYFTWAAFYLCI